MKKTFKISLICFLLLSMTLSNQKAQAGIAKKIIVSGISLLVVYCTLNTLANIDTKNQIDPNAPEIKELKKIKKFSGSIVNFVDSIAYDTNESIKKNFGIDFNGIRKKIVSVIKDTQKSITDKLLTVLAKNAPDQKIRLESYDAKQKIVLKEMGTGDKDPISGLFELVKNLFKQLKTESQIEKNKKEKATHSTTHSKYYEN